MRGQVLPNKQTETGRRTISTEACLMLQDTMVRAIADFAFTVEAGMLGALS